MKQILNNMNVKYVMPWTTNDIAVILLNMPLFEKENTVFF